MIKCLMRIGLVAALLALVVAVSAAPRAEAWTGTEEPWGEAVTPVIASPIPQRQIVPVLGSDGRWHAMYEVLLTNTVAKPARVESVAVLDAASGRRVLRLGAKQLVASDLHMLDRNPVKDTTLPPGQSRVLFVSVAFGSRAAIPRRLVERFVVSALDPFTGKTGQLTYRAGAVPISRRRPPVLVPPLEGGGWLASDGCCTAAGHVSAVYGLGGKLQAAERYAIDWIKIGPDGRIFHGDPSVLADWYGYGAPILSTSAGVVTKARDGLPDQTPLVKPGALPLSDLPGNEVVVRMKNGLSAVYAHLVPGSMAVHVGERVAAGQQLGRLGNSGGSLAPHLHFHVVDGNSDASSDGFPYVLRSFGLAAQSDVGALGEALQGKAGFPTAGALHPVTHRGELPLGFTIDFFP
jgi:murein DD-endopeptidase MepM/ murein hydrolase activator NlpD